MCVSGIIDLVLKDEDEALKVTSAGLKVFERNDKKVRASQVTPSHIGGPRHWLPDARAEAYICNHSLQ